MRDGGPGHVILLLCLLHVIKPANLLSGRPHYNEFKKKKEKNCTGLERCSRCRVGIIALLEEGHIYGGTWKVEPTQVMPQEVSEP